MTAEFPTADDQPDTLQPPGHRVRREGRAARLARGGLDQPFGTCWLVQPARLMPAPGRAGGP